MDEDSKYTPAVVGVDLAGSPNRATGICKLEGDKIVSCITYFLAILTPNVPHNRPAMERSGIVGPR